MPPRPSTYKPCTSHPRELAEALGHPANYGLRRWHELVTEVAELVRHHSTRAPARPNATVDRETLVELLTTADKDLHNEHGGDGALMNRNYLEYLADRLIAADAIAGTP